MPRTVHMRQITENGHHSSPAPINQAANGSSDTPTIHFLHSKNVFQHHPHQVILVWIRLSFDPPVLQNFTTLDLFSVLLYFVHLLWCWRVARSQAHNKEEFYSLMCLYIISPSLFYMLHLLNPSLGWRQDWYTIYRDRLP